MEPFAPRPHCRPQLLDIQADRWLFDTTVDDPWTSGAIVRDLFEEVATRAPFALWIGGEWKARWRS
jgi:hypothetical protein